MAFGLDEKGNFINIFGVKNGENAPVVIFKGTKSTLSDLPASGTVGDAYFVTATAHFYAWDGTQWADIGAGFTDWASLSRDNTFSGVNTFDDLIMAEEIDDGLGVNIISVADDGTRKVGSVLKGLKLASDEDIEVRKGNEETIGYVVDTLNKATTLSDYSTTTQMNTAISNHHDSTKANARTTVTDTESTTITLANAQAGYDYVYGTLSALTVTANDTSLNETTIQFTADSTITVTLPNTLNFIGGIPTFNGGKKYVIAIFNNNCLVGGTV